MFGLARLGRRNAPRLPALLSQAWTALRDAVAADRDRLVLWLPPCLGAGVLCYFAQTTEPPLLAGVALVVVSAFLFALVRRSRLAHAATASLLALSIGFLSAEMAARRMPPMPSLPRKAALATGRVAAIDVMADGQRRVTLDRVTIALAPRKEDRAAVPPPAGPDTANPATASPGAVVATPRVLRLRLRPDDATVLATGDVVRIRALLRPPSPPDLPSGRDLQRDAFFSGLAGSGRALSPVAVLSHGTRRGMLVGLRRLRERVADRIQLVLPGPRGAVAATLLTGLSSAIPQADRDAFAASGLAHLLAVAGLHLGIVMGLSLSLVRIGLASWEWGALRLPCRQIAAIAALVAGGFYMLLTGLHLPGLRSLAMATVAMLGLVIGRRAVSLRALAFAAALILLLTPAVLLDVAFQMSFAAVLALLAGYEAARPLTRRLQGPRVRDRVAFHVFQLFFTSLVAGAASLPFAAFHFGRVQFYFVLANLVAVPLTAFWVMPQGLLSLLLMPWGLDWPTLRAMGAGIDLILLLARAVAALPAASLPVPSSPASGLLLVSFGLCWLCLWRRRWRLLGLLPIALGLASPWLVRPPDLLVSEDAQLVALRDGRTMLVEQGARTDPITLSDWQRAWAIASAPTPFPDAGPADPSGNVVCNPAACLLVRRGHTVMLLRDPTGGKRKPDQDEDEPPALEPGDCDGVSLLVSPAPAHGACPGVPRIDRFTVWREGPQAVWIGRNRVTVRSALGSRGDRPWVRHAPSAVIPRPTLPLAPAE